MTKKPIPFSGPMVRAILEGRKTQTRRTLKINPPGIHVPAWKIEDGRFCPDPWVKKGRYFVDQANSIKVSYNVGDVLWVREEHYRFGHWEPVEGVKTKTGRVKWRFVADRDDVLFEAPEHCRKGRHHKDPNTPAWHKRLARFMPKALHRITLEVTAVKVERLQDISEADCLAEGAKIAPGEMGLDGGVHVETDTPFVYATPRAWYRELWDAINGPGSWDKNPFVAAYSFEVVT